MSLILSISCALAAHFFHAARWGLFIIPFGETRKSHLYFSLSVGYFINIIFPFRIGELVRVWLLYKKTKIDFSYILSTVIFDRIFDFIFISIVFVCISLANFIQDIAIIYYLIISIGLVIFLILILRSIIIRKIIYQVAYIFNDRIKLIILSIAWSLYTTFRIFIKNVNKRTFLVYTFAMWIFYIASLFNLVWFFTSGELFVYFKTLFVYVYSFEVHQQSLAYSLAKNLTPISEYSLIMTLFIILFIWWTPLIIVMIYANWSNTIENRRTIISRILERTRGVFFQDNGKLKILPFRKNIDQLNFLSSFFISRNVDSIITIHEINQNVNILEDMSGGSGATTNLIIKDNNIMVRKYALGNEAHKLKIQYKWLNKYQDLLPVTKIIDFSQMDNFFFYDMEYDSSCISLFNHIHSQSVNESWHIIESAFNVLEAKLYRGTEHNSRESDIQKYFEKKYLENINFIKSNQKISQLYNYDNIIINGNEYKNLKYYHKYFSVGYLSKLLLNEKCSEIHGDMTIENIIYSENYIDRYYLIDPNPDNIYNHYFIDYAKMRQSLNMGYEFLNSVPYVFCSDNIIEFPLTITDQYVKLLERFDQFVHSQFEDKGFMSVLFHEIVNYARLLPYKLRFDPENSIMYYAILLILHNSFYDEYYEK